MADRKGVANQFEDGVAPAEVQRLPGALYRQLTGLELYPTIKVRRC